MKILLFVDKCFNSHCVGKKDFPLHSQLEGVVCFPWNILVQKSQTSWHFE